MTEFGYAIMTYQGIFTVDSDGEIDVQLEQYPYKWPSMYLCHKGDKALLVPVEEEMDRNFGKDNGMDSYWPFYHADDVDY